MCEVFVCQVSDVGQSHTDLFVCIQLASCVLSQDCRQDCITLLSVMELIELSKQIKIKSGNDRQICSGIMRGDHTGMEKAAEPGSKVLACVHTLTGRTGSF